MARFMDEAKAAAAREFGARNYRAFLLAAVARRSAPALAALLIAAGLALGGFWVADHWDSWMASSARAGSAAANWLAPALIGVAAMLGISGLVAAVVLVWRRQSWRWRSFT